MFRFIFLSVAIFLFASAGSQVKDSPILIERQFFNYYSETDQFVEVIDSAVVEARIKLNKILNDTLDYRPDIYIERKAERFNELIHGTIPDWGAAVAVPHRHMIIIKSPAHYPLGKSLSELVKHEYAHLALTDRLGLGRPPRWLDEGLAMYIAAEWGWSNNLSLSKAVIFGSLIPLDEFEQMNRFPQGKAQQAYAQSYMAVKYLLDAYGIESFNILLDNLAIRKTIDETMMASIGSDYGGFTKEYVDYIKQHYNLVTLFIDMSYFWLFLALLVIIGFLLRFWRKKKHYRKWEEDEKYHSTDFDYGDPDNPEQIEDEDKPWA